jgi:hypothetical protein
MFASLEAGWECPCGTEPPKRGRAATPVRTIVSLREPRCPFCNRPYKDEYRLEHDSAATLHKRMLELRADPAASNAAKAAAFEQWFSQARRGGDRNRREARPHEAASRERPGGPRARGRGDMTVALEREPDGEEYLRYFVDEPEEV